MRLLQQTLQIRNLSGHLTVIMKLLPHYLLMPDEAFPETFQMGRTDVQFRKEHLLRLSGHAERFPVRKTVIDIILYELQRLQEIHATIKFTFHSVPLRFAFVKKTQIMVSDIVITIIDKQMRENKQQHFIIRHQIHGFQFLDKNKMPIALQQMFQPLHGHFVGHFIVVTHLHDFLNHTEQCLTTQTGAVPWNIFLIALERLNHFPRHTIVDTSPLPATNHQSPFLQLVNIIHVTYDSCGAAFELPGEVADTYARITAVIDEHRHHDSLLPCEFHFLREEFDGACRLAEKICIQVRILRHADNFLHSSKHVHFPCVSFLCLHIFCLFYINNFYACKNSLHLRHLVS